MAARRMFSIELINSDEFISLSSDAKVVYFYLLGKADDDGFVNGVSSVLRVTGASEKEVTELKESNFILMMSEKVYLIKHWLTMNVVPISRKQPTLMGEFRDELDIVDGVYKLP